MMKRILCLVLCVLLSLGLLRSASGSQPLGLSGFLDAVSTIDISFTDTLESVTALKDSLSFPVMTGKGFFEKISNFCEWMYNVFLNVVRIPVAIIVDILDFLYSIFEFFYKLIGMNYNPADKFGDWDGNFKGVGGGGGAR